MRKRKRGVRKEMKLNRNDPCWCGSGKKYKFCHEEFDKRIEKIRLEGHIVPSHDIIKTPEQVEKIKESARINMACLDEVGKRIHEGMATQEIDDIVNEVTYGMGGIPAPLNYGGFPKSVCTSVNDQVCHGFPSKDVILRECCDLGLEQVKPWGFLGDVGEAVHTHAEAHGYSVVREIGGHGVGLEFHEDPFVSYVTNRGEDMLMVPGMIFTIEPMINAGTAQFYTDESNDWEVYTLDGEPSAQWEYQVLVTEDGHEVISY